MRQRQERGPQAHRQHTNGGFTVVELVAVIVIISLLAVISIVSYNGIQERAQARVLESDVSHAADEIQLAATRGEGGKYPTSLDDMAARGVTLNSDNGVVYAYYYNSFANSFCIEGRLADNQTLVRSSLDSSQSLTDGDCSNNGIIGWWTMNGTADDQSRTKLTGTAPGLTSTSNKSGKANAAYTFNGNDTYLNVTNDSALHPERAMSFALWIRPASWPSTNATSLIAKRINASHNSGYFIHYLAATGKLSFDMGSASTRWNTNYTPPLNQWTHIVLTASTDRRSLYVNGALYSESSTPTLFAANNADLIIGAEHPTDQITGGGQYGYFGSTDDVRIYSRALTAAEAQKLYTNGPQ